MTINALVTNYKNETMTLDLVKVLGLNKTVTNVDVNGQPFSNYLYNIPDNVCICRYHFFTVNKDLLFVNNIDIVNLWS